MSETTIDTNELYDAARTYAAEGLPIFALAPRSKMPARSKADGGNGFHDATTDVDEINGIWGWTHPDANIGCAPLPGMIVVDIDDDTEFRKLIDQHGRLPETWVARTGSGGYHYWFTTDVADFRGRLCAGVDLKHGAAGYVVMPPSIHPSGDRYEWVQRAGDRPAQAPRWLEDMMRKPSRPEPQERPISHASIGTGRGREGYIDDQLRLLARMPEHGDGEFEGRNPCLNIVGLRLARIPGMNKAHLRDLLHAACVTNGLLGDDGQARVDATIDSAFRKADLDGPYPDKPGYEPNPPAFTMPLPDDGDGDGGDAAAAEALASQFMSGGSFVLDVPDVPPAVWGRDNDVLWAEGESLMIAGPMGLGKTTLGGQLMRAQLGIGPSEVLGLPVRPVDGKILYLAMDRPAQARRAMRRQFRPEHRQILDDRLVVWPGPPPADVAKRPGLLTRLAELADASVVYLDSVKDAAVGLSEDAVGAGYNRARQLLMQSGVQLAELHHTTKRGANGGPPKDVSDIYGSTWITNGTGSIILLSGDPGDPIVGFRHVRQPMDELGPWQLLHDQHAGEITIHHTVDPLELIRLLGADGLTARGFAFALLGDEDATPTRGQVEKARRKLQNLEDAGLLRSVEGGRGGGHDRTPTAWFIADGTVL